MNPSNASNNESYVDKVARLRSLGRLVPAHEQDRLSLYFALCDADPSTEQLAYLFHELSSVSKAYIKLYQEVSSPS